MHTRIINRKSAALVAAVGALGASAASAGAAGQNYCDPLGGCKPGHYLRVSPGKVKHGRTTTVSGAVGKGCKGPATVYSRAFKGATKNQFAGVPAFYIKLDKKGRFSKRVTIRKSVKPGSYHIGGRCGGGNFGGTTLKVTR